MPKKIYYWLLGMGSICNGELTNWAKNQHCKAKILYPKNTQEIIEIIQKAKNESLNIRAYGSNHSWSDIVCTDGYLINTDKLNKVVSVNTSTNQVTFQAGIKLKDLNKHLAKLGLNLSNQGAITEQSLAGVVSTATHGSGKTGTFSSFITKLHLLTADGQIQECSPEINSDLFSAARTSIGTLGVITELTVQCEPLFKVKRENKQSNWDNILKDYKKLLQDNDFMQFYWNASDDSVDIIIHNRLKETDQLGNSQTGDSYKMLSGSRSSIYYEEEIAVPLDKFIEAAKATRDLVKTEYNKVSGPNAPFQIVLFRFVSADKQNLLSPAADKDVVYFSITTRKRRGSEKFYKKFYDLMLQYDGRPHWGKINYLTREDAHKLYGKNFEKFIEIRKKLDPNGLFSNAFTKRIFGW